MEAVNNGFVLEELIRPNITSAGLPDYRFIDGYSAREESSALRMMCQVSFMLFVVPNARGGL